MIWISFGKWSSKSDSMFIWERVYRNGNRWTPFVMGKIRYSLTSKPSDGSLPTYTVACPVPPRSESDLSKLEKYYGKDFLNEINKSPCGRFADGCLVHSSTYRTKGILHGVHQNEGIPTYEVWTNPKKKYLHEILEACNTFNLVKWRPKPKTPNIDGWTYPREQELAKGLQVIGFKLSPGEGMTNFHIINKCKLMATEACCPYLVCGTGGFACAKSEAVLSLRIRSPLLPGGRKAYCPGILNVRKPL